MNRRPTKSEADGTTAAFGSETVAGPFGTDAVELDRWVRPRNRRAMGGTPLGTDGPPYRVKERRGPPVRVHSAGPSYCAAGGNSMRVTCIRATASIGRRSPSSGVDRPGLVGDGGWEGSARADAPEPVDPDRRRSHDPRPGSVRGPLRAVGRLDPTGPGRSRLHLHRTLGRPLDAQFVRGPPAGPRVGDEFLSELQPGDPAVRSTLHRAVPCARSPPHRSGGRPRPR